MAKDGGAPARWQDELYDLLRVKPTDPPRPASGIWTRLRAATVSVRRCRSAAKTRYLAPSFPAPPRLGG
jgi:hypothetical protein